TFAPMNREYHRWYSPRLGKDMQLLVFGHAGTPLLVFPTSQGRFFEYEDRGMIAAVSWRYDSGAVQAYYVDSVDAESWYNRRVHPRQRVRHPAVSRRILRYGLLLPVSHAFSARPERSVVSGPLPGDAHRAGHGRARHVPGREPAPLRHAAREKRAALAGRLGQRHGTRLAVVAAHGPEVFRVDAGCGGGLLLPRAGDAASLPAVER